MMKLGKCRYMLWMTILLGFSFNGNAEEITVPPGVDTLKVAVDNANEGDVLLLSPGTYSFAYREGYVFVNKDLTIRALSKSSPPVIDMGYRSLSTTSEPGTILLASDKNIVIQGLVINSTHNLGASL